MKQEPAAVGELGQLPNLFERVDRAELGGLRDRDKARLHCVLVAQPDDRPLDELGGQLAVRHIDR
jgi:hypothetical protein